MRLTKVVRISIALITSSLLLTSCSTTGDASASTNSITSQAPIGTNGSLVEIISDNVSAAGYEVNSMVMTVQFDSGALYEYYGVPADIWTSFLAAQPHPWTQVGYPRLVRGAIPYKRIR